MAHPVTAKRLFDITAADVSYLCCYPNSCTLLDMVRWFLPEIGRRDKWLFSFRDSCWKQQCCLHWKVEILQDHHLHKFCRTWMKMSVHKLPEATLPPPTTAFPEPMFFLTWVFVQNTSCTFSFETIFVLQFSSNFRFLCFYLKQHKRKITFFFITL